MSRYILYLAMAILSTCGITLLFSSCEEVDRDLPGKGGKKIPVTFSINPVGYNGDENAARSMEEPETTVIPIGDGMFMHLTLEPDNSPSAMRVDQDSLIDGTVVCIVVYKDDTNKTYVDHALDTIKDGKAKLAQHTFELEEDKLYNFVAYAYNKLDSINPQFVPTLSIINGNDPVIQNIPPAVDLLYGNRMHRKVQKITSLGGDTVWIPMWHLFSRISEVQVVPGVATPPIKDIGQVTLSTFKGNLQVATANYDSDTSITDDFTPSEDSVKYLLPAYSSSDWTGTPSKTSSTLSSVTRKLDEFTLDEFKWLVFPGVGTGLIFDYIELTDGHRYPEQPDSKLMTTFNKKLLSSHSYILKVTVTKEAGGVSGTIGANTYVGAFWRATQRGERIIRIPVTGTPEPRQWVAAVEWLDDRWDPEHGDGILLLPGGSTDPDVSYIEDKTPHSAESYKIDNGYTSINGFADNTHPILFRIGLQKTHDQTESWTYEPDNPTYTDTSYPARYALVKLYFGGKVHTLYLRQGEGADYVMYDEAITTGGYSHTTGDKRPSAVRFSPYNLTAATMNAPIARTYDGTGGQEAKFTQYPTQAGAYFQWDNTTDDPDNRARYAWDPRDIILSSSDWNYKFVANTYWHGTANLHINNESCPTGYRRPTDGRTDGAVTIVTNASAIANPGTSNIYNSEVRQSLYLNPQSGYDSSMDNCIFGYYADGFFDRRQITASVNGRAATAVAVATDTVAYTGGLCYNLTTKASLFFPATGHRDGGDGALLCSGWFTEFWTSSASITNAWYVSGYPLAGESYDGFSGGDLQKQYGASIRCVKPDASLTLTIQEEEWEEDTFTGNLQY